VLEHAVRGVLAERGWTIDAPGDGPGAGLGDEPGAGPGDEPREQLQVVDETGPGRPPHRTVLVCAATPVACATALGRLVRGHVGAIVPDDRLGVLPDVLAALRHRRTLLELEVIDLAALVPHLDARHHAVLQGLLAGQSATDIASRAYLSPATVKRAVALLRRELGVRSGLQLTRRATSLGYEPREVTGPIP
jgi:DNA-binding CsgD family transcriptional regulator